MQAILIDKKYFSDVAIIDSAYNALQETIRHKDYNSRISFIVSGKLKEEACGKEVFAQCGSIGTNALRSNL